jgi:2-methylcitrate dehydratase PrpD
VTPTERLLAFAAAEHRLPAEMRAGAERLLADTLAVGAAGASAPGADAVLAAARGWGAGEESRLLGASLDQSASPPPRPPSSTASAFTASNGTRCTSRRWCTRSRW